MNIKELRISKGLTQTDVAKTVGVSLTAYQIWERGVGKPSPDNLKKLEKALSVK